MGVKVVIATGVKNENASKIALDTGILKKEHKKICGSVIEGPNLRKIAMGTEDNHGYSITPEYLSVVCRANNDERALVVDYLMKKNPGLSCGN